MDVFQSGGNDAQYLKLIRRYSKQNLSKAIIAEKEAIQKRTPMGSKSESWSIESVRDAIKLSPKVAELRFELVIHLLRNIPGFGLTQSGETWWIKIEPWELYSGLKGIAKKVLRELNLALAFGFTEPLKSAKARFLVIALSVKSADLQSVAQRQSKRCYSPGRDEAEKRLLPLHALAEDIILDTARHLRRDPHDVEAISIQKAAYEFLGDQKGVGKAEQTLRQSPKHSCGRIAHEALKTGEHRRKRKSS